MKITKCPKYKTKDGTEAGKCVEDFVTKEYRIPTIDEYVEDIIELNVPEPISDCRSFKLNIPETICRVSIPKLKPKLNKILLPSGCDHYRVC